MKPCGRQTRLLSSCPLPSDISAGAPRCPASAGRNRVADRPQDICVRRAAVVSRSHPHPCISSSSINGQVCDSNKMTRAIWIIAMVSLRDRSGSTWASDHPSSLANSLSITSSYGSTSRSSARRASASSQRRISISMARTRISIQRVSGFLSPGSYGAAGNGLPLLALRTRGASIAISRFLRRASVSRRQASFWSSMSGNIAAGVSAVTQNGDATFGVAP